MNKHFYKQCYYISLLVLILLAAVDGQAQKAVDEGEGDEGVNFRYGDSCTRLADLPEEAVMTLIKSRNREYWQYFCQLDERSLCDDFSYVFDGLGFLMEARQRSDMCRFEPYRELQEWVPDYYGRYGKAAFDQTPEQWRY